MLDPRPKNLLRFICSFIGHEQGVAIVEEYEEILIPMLLKFYHHFYPLSEVKSSFVGKSDETCQLDIFEMIAKKVQAK
jgi:hypothetical protein